MKIIVTKILLTIIALISVSSEVICEPDPVILDTDIGSDIDDTWALSLLLASPELDCKLIVTDSHNTVGKAQIVAKFLQEVGRSDIPIGIGKKMDERVGHQYNWADDYPLESYPGKIYEDGVQAMIDTIMASTKTVTLFVIGPCPNIELALQKEPKIADKTKVIAMSGSIDKGYGGTVIPDAEYNIRDNIAASQSLYSASWELTIAPLDTAGIVQLEGSKYQNLQHGSNYLIDTLLKNYRAWVEHGNVKLSPDTRSSTLFDTVAVYLAIDQSYCEMEKMKLSVDGRGFTVRDPKGKIVNVAMKWKDLDKFEDFLISRLKGGVTFPKRP